jgi:hypothetical protein
VTPPTSKGPSPLVVTVPDGADAAALRELLARAGVVAPRPTVVLVGGAGGMDGASARRSEELIATVLVPMLEHHRAYLVDGGTDSGVMAMAGRARKARGAVQPQIGVVAAGTLDDGPNSSDESDESGGRAPAEPHHSHLLVVPGARWGDEIGWMRLVVGALSDPLPSVTVLAGTGRTADRLAASIGASAAGELAELAASPLVILATTVEEFRAALDDALG